MASRNQDGLNETKAAIEAARLIYVGAETAIDLITVDLSDMSQLTAAADAFFSAPTRAASSPGSRIYSKIIFVNNAGKFYCFDFRSLPSYFLSSQQRYIS